MSTTSSPSLHHHHHHPPPPWCHDEAGCRQALLCSAASFLSCITKVNSFSSQHGSSICRIIFCVSWQFCVCRVMVVCFGIRTFIGCVCDTTFIGVCVCTAAAAAVCAAAFVMLCVCVADNVDFCFMFFYQSLISCRHPPWTHQSTNSSPTLQPPSTPQREVRQFVHIQTVGAIQNLHIVWYLN